MKDFISKLTFGFLMAQLLPGVVVILAFTCTLQYDDTSPETCLDEMLSCVDTCWFQSPLRIAAFSLLSLAVGMLIHGLNWTVLSWLETKCGDSRQSFWHKHLIVFQIVVSPIKMIWEVLWLLFAPDIDCLTTDENVHEIAEDRMPQFTFLQEFYLNFGQFYAHMAYATLVVTILVAIRLVQHLSIICYLAFLGFYLLTSVLFLLGRIQLGSLFKAEALLTKGLVPVGEYRVPILQALSGMGGSGDAEDVLDRVGEEMMGLLSEPDYEPLRSEPDTPRWRSVARWARNTMVNEGLLKKDSPRGIWEISDKGKQHLQQNR